MAPKIQQCSVLEDHSSVHRAYLFCHFPQSGYVAGKPDALFRLEQGEPWATEDEIRSQIHPGKREPTRKVAKKLYLVSQRCHSFEDG